MAITKEAEKLISQLENSPEGRKHGRDARAYAVDNWKIHTGEWEKPVGKTPMPSWIRPQRPSPRPPRRKPKSKS